ncbi:MAG: phosphatidylinositol kinase [Faunusvirus sp.]|jgi:hypothetical protein|uniref:Phosphatidylinositol kinase n=1 Tax=Faunusvirus sp. TaxID=2487766 RepID=A0A3G4ZX52_9VIRU|nr:MAG: phosphatidylinositol kinase [Faunusvirus sp.]
MSQISSTSIGNKINIISNGKLYCLHLDVIKYSNLLNNLYNTSPKNSTLKLTINLQETIMKIIVAYLNKLVKEAVYDDDNETDEHIDDVHDLYDNINDGHIIDIIIAAEYFELDELKKYCKNKIFKNLKQCENADEFRTIMHIKNDLSATYIMEINNENAWNVYLKKNEIIETEQLQTSDFYVNKSEPIDIKCVKTEDNFEILKMTPQQDVVRFTHDRKPNKAVDDSTVDKCYNCKSTFNFYYRKHHCRACGRIFCHKCSDKKIEISENDKMMESSNITHITNMVMWLFMDIEKERVCDKCYGNIVERRGYSGCIHAFNIMAPELPYLKKMATICTSWRRAAIYCLSSLRELQYKLPTREFTKYEKLILWNNRWYWCGHSQWLIQLLRSVDFDTTENTKKTGNIVDEILSILTSQKINPCNEMMCNRLCTNTIKPRDSLYFISRHVKNSVIREHIIKEYISKASDEELICYIPLLVHNLRHESISTHSPLAEFLFDRAKSSVTISVDLYWQLTICATKNHTARYNVLKNKLIAIVQKNNSKIADELESGATFVSILIECQSMKVEDIKLMLRARETETLNVTLPIKPDIAVTEFNIDEIHMKTSYTAPLIIPYTYKLSTGSTSSTNIIAELMFKKEDVRKDKIILNVIKLMDLILKKNNINIPVIIYNVVPVSDTNGLIEMVPNSETLFNVIKNGSIMTYLGKYNGSRSINDICQTYTSSLAFWTVITHLLGIGDRHMENIMITQDGVLFHVDYGFVLGQDSKPLVSNIRMDRKMIEAMGGKDKYKSFKELCCKIFLCLRRYSLLFYNMLILLSESDPPIKNLQYMSKYLEDQLLAKFLPGHSDGEAGHTMDKVIDQSCDAFIQKMTDYIHYVNKESPVTKNIISVGSAVSQSISGITGWLYSSKKS